MNSNPGLIRRFFSASWRVVDTSRKLVVNLIFLAIIIAIIGIISSDDTQVTVPENSALVLNLRGDLVEQKVAIDPMDALFNEALGQKEERPEVLVSNVLSAIEHAKNDDRIKLLVLKLDQLGRGGLSKLQDIGQALNDFKGADKHVIALGDSYSQGQYYLASYADEIWLDPKGYLLLDGFGRYQLYFKSALEKLAISPHIFRVGTYKSAVEPYIRDDMSEEAKAANQLWLNDLWQEYKKDVAKERGFETSNFDENIESLLTKFSEANGSFAEYAKQNQWVDSLKTRDEMVNDLMSRVGKNTSGEYFKHINYKSYLKAIKPPFPLDTNGSDKVAVVVAKGTILNGNQAPGTIGGDSTAKLLKRARFDKQVKAVVLRVDSPGGSAYASEIIRQEVELLKQAGKPVVASMGSVAASGGYWISASADKIVASPTTITGSIGIFGMFMTLENTLGKLGIHTDGVGTTDIAGFGVTRPLSEGMSKLFQLSINRGYEDFISLVAENRAMTKQQVDKVAQGRVWSGIKAQELGLVDELGSLDEAVNIAADLAKLEDFEQVLIERELSPQDLFWQNLVDSSAFVAEKLGYEYQSSSPIAHMGQARQIVQQVIDEVKQLEQFNDPQGIYSFCLTCEVN
ncbi:signal peptide peptidase SppA [Thalassotalea euphylliae]|uniref:Signal peptide peptidase SppA n=1 Tax=Thalassotalea euphylliae TaxID=1655234 RepID=A0A3E0UHL7_9GAMM|nr:signal peptide peptidase SppA [Thalassotalea euphylliae]REL35665.1 signal peptide peptidase SppA [Thalassotalea euphylliae]